jgi:hypothetical protein
MNIKKQIAEHSLAIATPATSGRLPVTAANPSPQPPKNHPAFFKTPVKQ